MHGVRRGKAIPMRYYLAEAIRINRLRGERRRAEFTKLPLGTRTTIAVLAKHLQGRTHDTRCDARASERAQ